MIGRKRAYVIGLVCQAIGAVAMTMAQSLDPMAALLNLVAPAAALGAAEYAVELFRERMLVRKVKNTLDNRQADSPIAQARYSQALEPVVTARLHWKETIKVVSAANERQPPVLTDEECAPYRLSLALSAPRVWIAAALKVRASFQCR